MSIDLWFESLNAVWGNFHFIRPWCLFFLLPALVIYGLAYWNKTSADPWRFHIQPNLLKALTIKAGRRAWFGPANFSLITAFVWIFALAGPSWQQKESPLNQDDKAIAVVLQLNESMLSDDLIPTRLQHAKLKLISLFEKNKSSAFSLIVVAGSAHVVMPFTKDQQAITNYLSDLQPALMPKQGVRKGSGKDEEQDLAISEAYRLAVQNLALYSDAASNAGRASGTVIILADDSAAVVSFEPPANIDDDRLNKIVWQFLPLQDIGLTDWSNYQSYGFTAVALSADDSDLNRVQGRLSQNWFNARPSDDVEWQDAGYYLVWPLLVLLLMWFRRGMVLSWD